MKVKEAAAWLEVSESAVYALCSKGQLTHSRVGVGRGAIRISEEDLQDYRKSCKVSQPSLSMDLKHIKTPPGGSSGRRP
jgi:excisionase family DNA binding protein